jgi:glycosyltransferase involved in cell wall biosynthesis
MKDMPGTGAVSEAAACDIGLVMHQAETHSRGGPSVRVPRTVAALRALGVDARMMHGGTPRLLAHVFNIWPFVQAFGAVRALKRQGVRVAFSPILLLPGDGVRHGLGPPPTSGLPDYANLLVRKTLAEADMIIALSAAEAALVQTLSGGGTRCEVVPNPVDAAPLQHADPRVFLRYAAARWAVDLSRGFVLAVGRIEPRKNQLRLIESLAGGPPLVIIGHDGDPAFAAACRGVAGPRVCFVERLDGGSGLLASAYAACRLLAHVALAEGATLVALEAAAAGAPLLLSDHPAHREYFGPFARYVPALDLDAIRTAALDLWDHPPLAGERALQSLHVAEAHNYAVHAARLAAHYADALR